jgi:hypothetical protein
VRYFLVLLLCSLLCACDLPHSTVRTGAPAPALIVTGAPANSLLYVDGVQMGAATTFNGKPYTISVLEGVHMVDVRVAGKVIYSEKVFVGSGETHAVNVLVGASQ